MAAKSSGIDLGKGIAGGMSGYLGVDAALRVINSKTLLATLADPSGSIAVAINLVMLVAAMAYLGSVAGVLKFSGPR